MQTVHAGNDRASGVLQPDCGRNRVGPIPRLIAVFHRAQAVAFVAEVPGGDCRVVLHSFDKIANKPHLPFDRQRVGKGVQAFQRRRNEHASAHPAGNQPDNQANAVLFGLIGQETETRHHFFINPGPTSFGIRQRFVIHVDHFTAAVHPHGGQRLKIRPQRKNPQHGQTVRAHKFKVGGNRFRRPVTPHIDTGMGRPIVTAGDECSRFKILRYFHGRMLL